MKQLPENPNLDHLKGQAKELLRTWRLANPDDSRKLADAQHSLAGEYGFSTWADLKHEVQRLNDERLDPDEWVKQSVMRKLFAPASEAMVRENYWVALACGRLDVVRAFVESDPGLVTQKGGPFEAEPICYVCCSRSPGGDRVGTARFLLERGADPNAQYIDPMWPDWPLAPLWGACGVRFDAELAEVLISAGAEVNDNESLYHSTESDDPDCLKVLLKHGANPANTNALKRALDFDRTEAVRLLLEHGADPNEVTQNEDPVHHAIRRRRSAAFFELMHQHGARFDTKSRDGIDVMTHARLRSPADVVEFLSSLGVQGESSEVDEYVAAVSQNDLEKARALREADPSLPSRLTPMHLSLMPEAGWEGATDLILRYVEFGWPLDAGEINFEGHQHKIGPTVLHTAGFNGHAETVEAMIRAGAPVDVVETMHESTPLGWVLWARAYGSSNPDGEYAECVRLLIEAGSPLPSEWARGDAEIDALMEVALSSR